MTDVAPLSDMQPLIPTDERSFIQKWEVEYNRARSARIPFERQWYLNIAFWSGRQWVQWDSSPTSPGAMGRLIEPPTPSNRVRITVNRIRRLMNKQLAKLNKEEIRGYISPATPDDEDIAASRSGEKLNDYLIELTNLNEKMSRADWWMLICGTSFLKDRYDQSIRLSGPSIQDPQTGENQPIEVYGAPTVEVVSPFHLLVPNLDEPDLDKQAWIMHVVVRTKKEIQDQYGVQVEQDEILASNSIEARLLSAQGLTSQNAKRGIEVKEVWVAPCAEYPNGMVLAWTNEKVLSFYPEWPYSYGEHPFHLRRHVETGRFYGESTVTDLIPLQVEYNRSRSQIIEDKNRMARPALTAMVGSIDPRKIRGVPGEIIEYKPGTERPQALQMPNVPGYVIDHLQLLQKEMEEISEQAALEQGVPSGVTAATAIAYIQENQDSVLALTLRNKEKVYERLCRHMLALVIQFWDAQRQIKVVGQNQNFEGFLLSATDLRGNTDWRVQTGSATPVSYSAKQAQIMELMKGGMIPVDRGLQYMNMGDTAKLFEEMQVDVREAERQNVKMSRGVPTVTGEWQNLLVHVKTHDDYRKREEFENADENVQAIFRHHVFMDMMVLATKTGMDFPPEVQMNLMRAQQQDPLYVDDNLEKGLRRFVETLMNGASVPQQGQQPSS